MFLIFCQSSTNRFLAFVAGSNADTFGKIQYKYFPVSDLSRSCAFDNRIDGSVEEILIYGDLQPDLFEQIDLELDAAVAFLVP